MIVSEREVLFRECLNVMDAATQPLGTEARIDAVNGKIGEVLS